MAGMVAVAAAPIAAFAAGGTNFTYVDAAPETIGEIAAGFTIENEATGWSAFAKADAFFGDDYTSIGGEIGVRKAF